MGTRAVQQRLPNLSVPQGGAPRPVPAQRPGDKSRDQGQTHTSLASLTGRAEGEKADGPCIQLPAPTALMGEEDSAAPLGQVPYPAPLPPEHPRWESQARGGGGDTALDKAESGAGGQDPSFEERRGSCSAWRGGRHHGLHSPRGQSQDHERPNHSHKSCH